MRFRAKAFRHRMPPVIRLSVLALGLSALASARTAAASDSPPVIIEHAWKQFLSYRAAVAELPDDGDARLEAASKIFLAPGNRFLRGYFAERRGGEELGVSRWVAVPHEAFDVLAAILADGRVQREIEDGAQDLVRRLRSMPAARDTVAFVFLVGGFQSYFTSFADGGTTVIAMHMESFVPLPASLSPKTRREIDAAIQWRPDTLATFGEFFPWCAYAYAQNFLPELRERLVDHNATLAEYAIYHGFSTRLAGALYPESLFRGGAAPVRSRAAALLEPIRQEIGTAWSPLGGEPYPLVLHDERLTAPIPEGATAQQAVAVLGTHLAEAWLFGTRTTPRADEAVEIATIGRVPTRMIWQLIEAY
jgi:hypothetical protein